MPRACSIKKLLKLVLAMILTVSMTGCHNKETNSLNKGEWISRIILKAGIQGHQEDQPYFMNINAQSEYFNDIQAAVEWHILDPSYPFDPNETLSNEWTAFTLVNLARDLPKGNSSSIRDISKTVFADQVSSAVASGLMKTDTRNMFHPKDPIDEETAMKCLDQVIEHINNRHFDEDIFEIEWEEGVSVYQSEPPVIDPETGEADVGIDCEAQAGDILVSRNGADYQAYKVVSRDGSKATLEPCDLSEEARSVNVQGSVKINFNECEIYDGNGNLIQPRPSGNHQNDHIHLMADVKNTYTYEIAGFDVKVKTSDASFSMDASKKMKYGEINASVALNDFKADYSFNSLFRDIKSTYYKLDFDTSQSLGVKADIKEERFGDFSRIDKKNFLSSLRSFMQKKDDAVETELKLAEILVPLGGMPFCDLRVEVKLQMKTNGKAEIVLSQKDHVGYEFVDDNFRFIKDTNHSQDISLKADTSLCANIKASLDTFGFCLMDTAVKAGAKASIKTKVHLFDDDGKMQTVETDASPELADEMASKVEDVVVCADASGNWILELLVFSKDCGAGKLLGETEYSILNEKNAPLFKGASQHFENWHAVDQCTRKSRPKSEEREVMDTKGKITLEQYSVAVHAGQSRSLAVTGLPEGYSLNDLVVSSSDPSIAAVNGLVVTGVSSGSAIITISTSDGSFSTSMNILVPQESGA